MDVQQKNLNILIHIKTLLVDGCWLALREASITIMP